MYFQKPVSGPIREGSKNAENIDVSWSAKILASFEQVWRWNFYSIPAVVLIIILEKFCYFPVTLKKIHAFIGCFISILFILTDLLQQVNPQHKSEIVIQLRETQVCSIHNLGFQSTLFGYFQNLSNYEELVSSL